MTVVDPETGAVDHRQDDPAAVATAADQLNEATLAIEGVDYNALTDDQLRDLLAAKATLSEVTLALRQRQHREARSGAGAAPAAADGGGDGE